MSGTSKSGAKGLPKRLKLLKGTYQSCRDNKNAPQPRKGSLKAPAYLPPLAAEEYERKAELLDRLGVFTEADDVALAAYAEAYARWRDALDKYHRTGPLLRNDKGAPVRNPLAYSLNNSIDQMYRFLTEFGLTPISRQRVSVDKEEGENEWSMFGDAVQTIKKSDYIQ